MEIASIIEPATREFVRLAIRKYGFPEDLHQHLHPQEDYLLVSKKHPIFVVADGVTLSQYLIDHEPYPHTSPAGDVARIFCEHLLAAAEARHESFAESDLREVFVAGNDAVRTYNAQHGRSKETSDFWRNDLYAATAAFAIMKDEQVYWGSICDSFVAHLRAGELLFKSPACESQAEVARAPFVGDPNDLKAKVMHTWSAVRNAVDAEGKLAGYGVVTGEEIAARYLCTGSFSMASGDALAIFTDGFESHLDTPEFRSLLTQKGNDLEGSIRTFSSTKAPEDPDKYGRERSLIAVRI